DGYLVADYNRKHAGIGSVGESNPGGSQGHSRLGHVGHYEMAAVEVLGLQQMIGINTAPIRLTRRPLGPISTPRTILLHHRPPVAHPEIPAHVVPLQRHELFVWS